MDSSNTCIRPTTTAQTLNRKMPKGTSGKEAIKENQKKNAMRSNIELRCNVGITVEKQKHSSFNTESQKPY